MELIMYYVSSMDELLNACLCQNAKQQMHTNQVVLPRNASSTKSCVFMRGVFMN